MRQQEAAADFRGGASRELTEMKPPDTLGRTHAIIVDRMDPIMVSSAASTLLDTDKI